MRHLEYLSAIFDEIGAKTLKGIIDSKISGFGGKEAEDVVYELAKRLSASPSPTSIRETYRKNTEEVAETILKFDFDVANGWLEDNKYLLYSENKNDFFKNGWRPVLSWIIIWLILLNSTVIPFLNGIWGFTIILVPWDQIFAITSIWLVVYSGGNTALRIFGDKKNPNDDKPSGSAKA